jgi:hypothetical protein
MLSSLFLSSLWFEAGSWFGFSMAKFGSREKNQNILIHGSDVRTTIPVADTLIAKQITHSTKTQRMIAGRLSKLIRAFVNTRAFELLVLQQIGKSWPGNKELSADIKFVA